MKVKISYTVDLQEIPERVDPLFEKIVKNVQESFELSKDLKSVKDNSIDGSLRHIEKLRNLLLESELLLSDCQDMLSGYLHILTSDQQQEEQEQ